MRPAGPSISFAHRVTPCRNLEIHFSVESRSASVTSLPSREFSAPPSAACRSTRRAVTSFRDPRSLSCMIGELKASMRRLRRLGFLALVSIARCDISEQASIRPSGLPDRGSYCAEWFLWKLGVHDPTLTVRSTALPNAHETFGLEVADDQSAREHRDRRELPRATVGTVRPETIWRFTRPNHESHQNALHRSHDPH